jgi:hypothetical protein
MGGKRWSRNKITFHFVIVALLDDISSHQSLSGMTQSSKVTQFRRFLAFSYIAARFGAIPWESLTIGPFHIPYYI